MPKLLEGGATRIVCGLNEEIKKSLHDLFITAYYHLLFDFTVSLASYDFFFLAFFTNEREREAEGMSILGSNTKSIALLY